MSSKLDKELASLAKKLVARCHAENIKIAVAESCTGGLLSAFITSVPGSSEIFDRGVVTYSNQAKNELLGVPMPLIKKHGAVSAEVARAMVAGVIKNSYADIAVSITGIAGPGGATPTKPVGLVYIGYAEKKKAAKAVKSNFCGSRDSVRVQAVKTALCMLLGNSTH